MDKTILINELPPYIDKWELVNEDQDVYDIISDILKRHKQFVPYYNKIALYFDRDTVLETANELYNFCIKNIKYKEETDKVQTTALPTGILLRGYGDCKHYSSFIGGCLDAINRLTGKNIDWCYRFASYEFLDDSPHHVFVVINPGKNELWIDPTPKSDKKVPYYQKDRKINLKKSDMALYANIAGTQRVGLIEEASELVSTVTGLFKNLLDKFVIGDQVPDYEVKSKATFEEILRVVMGLFTDPVSIEDAKRQLDNANRYAAEAYAKGGAVNNTYGKLFKEVAVNLTNYINSGGKVTYDQQGNPIPSPAPPPTTGSGSNLLLIGGLGLGALLLFGSGKNKVKGINDWSFENPIVWLVVAGIAYSMFSKPKPPAIQQTAQ